MHRCALVAEQKRVELTLWENKEEQGVLEMREIDECERDMAKLGTLYGSEKTIAILRQRWWPQAAKPEADR